jgi:serine phosphatase RsbU (regulator of sigma subunit)
MNKYRHTILFFVTLVLHTLVFGQTDPIELNDGNLNVSLAHKAQIFEDSERKYSLTDILRMNDSVFRPLKKPLDILDFNTSRWYVRFSLHNPKDYERLKILVETARPITSIVDLYEVKAANELALIGKSGNERPFKEKTYAHRKNIFPIALAASEVKHFILVMESDGEVINFPLIFWEAYAFHQTDYRNQFFHGFYFGVLALVVFIFFFFYLLLREISFLYYILYVAFQFLLQFSLEGYSSQYIFPNSPFWGNNMVLLSAVFTAFFLLIYAISFLQLKERILGAFHYFRIIIYLILLTFLLTLIPGITHALAYPIINIISLVGTVSIIVIIFMLKKRGHYVNTAFAVGFIMLIIGAVIFILGNIGVIGDARLSEMALKISSGLEILALSVSMAGKYKELQEEKELAQEKALENLERIVQERTQEVQAQKKQIEEQHKDILGSIKYAQRIQDAFLPKHQEIKNVLGEHFVLFLPRDIVSGDFYFVESVTTQTGHRVDLFAAVDCTGHGVPGAFMSFLGNNFLQQSTKRPEINSPAAALEFLNNGILETLKIKESIAKGQPIRDGMDMTLCGINRTTNELYFAGAKNSILMVLPVGRETDFDFNNESIKGPLYNENKTHFLVEIKGDKHPIGLYGEESVMKFTNHTFKVQPGDLIYGYSDGYIDQFGGPRNKKYGTKRFKSLVLEMAGLSMEEQQEKLEKEFSDWKGELEALDDVIVMGIRLG